MDRQVKALSWAYLKVDTDNTEGVIAVMTADMPMPLVGADLARAASLRPHAQLVADNIGRSVTVTHFSARIDKGTVTPCRRRATQC